MYFTSTKLEVWIFPSSFFLTFQYLIIIFISSLWLKNISNISKNLHKSVRGSGFPTSSSIVNGWAGKSILGDECDIIGFTIFIWNWTLESSKAVIIIVQVGDRCIDIGLDFVITKLKSVVNILLHFNCRSTFNLLGLGH